MREWLTATEAMTVLGVRPQTLYAYVSRGRIEARPDPDEPRRSQYRAVDVNRLRSRKTRGRKAALVAEDAIAWGEPVLASAITTVVDGKLYYRGRDAAGLELLIDKLKSTRSNDEFLAEIARGPASTS